MTTALGVVLFAFILRRPARREAHAVASLPGGPQASLATSPPPAPEVVEPVGRSGEATRRAQRQAGEAGALPAAHEPERFAAPARKGVERRTIGYRLVKLSDGPDDLRSREIGRLDRGDEVEVIGEEGGSLKVRTPSGLEGWVPRVAIVG